MFKYLQSRIQGTASVGPGAPPSGLIAFYWHFVSQTKLWYAAMFATSLAVTWCPRWRLPGGRPTPPPRCADCVAPARSAANYREPPGSEI